ncbi:hypothetical protein [Embleya sp. NPDC059237]|uniref:hypothetical protein n=1 Tax=Embleya sp. NPDC059237 TaxID=3346784 RepID=UPI0036C0C74C
MNGEPDLAAEVRGAVFAVILEHRLNITAGETSLLVTAVVGAVRRCAPQATRPGPTSAYTSGGTGRSTISSPMLADILADHTEDVDGHLVWKNEQNARIAWWGRKLSGRQVSFLVHRTRPAEGQIKRRCKVEDCVAPGCLADRHDRGVELEHAVLDAPHES